MLIFTKKRLRYSWKLWKAWNFSPVNPSMFTAYPEHCQYCYSELTILSLICVETNWPSSWFIIAVLGCRSLASNNNKKKMNKSRFFTNIWKFQKCLCNFSKNHKILNTIKRYSGRIFIKLEGSFEISFCRAGRNSLAASVSDGSVFLKIKIKISFLQKASNKQKC